MTIVNCTYCHSPKEVWPSRVKQHERHFCNTECKAKWQHENLAGKNSHAYKNAIETLECLYCGIQFRAYRSNERKYCSGQCYQAHRSETEFVDHICKDCGTVSKIKPSTNRDFCGECAKKRRQASPHPLRHLPFVFRCTNCHKVHAIPRGKAGDRPKAKHKFCDRDCKTEWLHKGNSNGVIHPAGPDHPLYTRITVECEVCGKELQRRRYRLREYNTQLCSTECMGIWRSENIAGPDHPTWRGGRQPGYRGPNWQRQAKKARKRDGYKCRHCGISQEKLGQKLDVHHIRSFRDFGYIPDENNNYKQANRLQNLISLCPSCHKKVEWHDDIPIQPSLL